MNSRFCSLLLVAASAYAQNATQAGKFVVEHPTLLNLGFEWAIAAMRIAMRRSPVQFRAVGESGWRAGAAAGADRRRECLPAARESRLHGPRRICRQHPESAAGDGIRMPVPADRSGRGERPDRADRQGEDTHASRSLPRQGRTLHVYPAGLSGPAQEPSFTGILQAYYGAGLGDWSVVWERRAQPGDTILMHAGLYKPERLNYVDPMMTPFDGTMSLTLKGTPEKPITIKAAGDGEVIFDGAGNHRLFDVMASQHHIFDGLTIRNTDVAHLRRPERSARRGRADGEELPL